MKSVIVTGATSMIGVALIEECVNNDIRVAAIIRPGTNRINRLPESDLISIYEYNLDELNTVEIAQDSFDVFYHFAWADTGKTTRDDPMLQEKNIKYTLEAVELAKKMGCTVFVGAGSQAEYGPVDGIISHKTSPHPVMAYGMAKEAARMLSARLCEQYGIRHIWGRIFSVYGRNDNAGTMLVYAVSRLINGETAEFSSGLQQWDYLNEHDAGRAFYLLGVCKNTEGIYCIANGESHELRYYIEELGKQLDATDKLLFANTSTGKEINLQADISRLVSDTGFRPEILFEDGIREVINAYKERI